MSQQKVSLAIGFLDAEPEAAAAIIELQRVEQAAAFLATIPSAKAAQVMAQMLPPYAAQLCLELPHEVTLAILVSMETRPLVSIFRLLSVQQRDLFLKELPARTQVACTLVLNYTETMVGAWMTTDVLTIPDQASVAEALQRVEATTHPLGGDSLFVVSRSRQLKGRVSLLELLRATREIPVITISKGNISFLRGRMGLSQAAVSPFWDRDELVPVVNRKDEFIGVLRHADLRRGIKSLNASLPQQLEAPDVLKGISQGYGQTLLALAQSMQEFVQAEIRPNSH